MVERTPFTGDTGSNPVTSLCALLFLTRSVSSFTFHLDNCIRLTYNILRRLANACEKRIIMDKLYRQLDSVFGGGLVGWSV